MRIGVYATAITTSLFFRQFIGRFTRRTPAPDGKQMAYCYLPVDPRLVHLAKEIEEEARHHISLDKLQKQEGAKAEGEEGELVTFVHDGALPHLTRNTGVEALVHSGRQLALFSNGNRVNGRVMEVTPLDIREMVEVQPLPESDPVGLETSRTLRERRSELGREIRRLVTLWHHQSGREFGAIYAEFNQRQRVQSQAKCTVDQLEQRIFWLEDRLRK